MLEQVEEAIGCQSSIDLHGTADVPVQVLIQISKDNRGAVQESAQGFVEIGEVFEVIWRQAQDNNSGVLLPGHQFAAEHVFGAWRFGDSMLQFFASFLQTKATPPWFWCMMCAE